MKNKEPWTATTSLENLAESQQLDQRNSTRNLLAWIADVRELLKDERLPADLSTRHDYYLWEEDVAEHA